MTQRWFGTSDLMPDWSFHIDVTPVDHTASVTPDLLDAIANGCDPDEEDAGDGEYVDEDGRIWKYVFHAFILGSMTPLSECGWERA